MKFMGGLHRSGEAGRGSSLLAALWPVAVMSLVSNIHINIFVVYVSLFVLICILQAAVCQADGTGKMFRWIIPNVTWRFKVGCRQEVAQTGKNLASAGLINLKAMKFVNSPAGRLLNLRGINAGVVQAGAIRVGDVVTVVHVQKNRTPRASL